MFVQSEKNSNLAIQNMLQIKAQIGQDHYTTQINSSTNTLVADEPLSNGGQEKGFAPAELLTASLAACTVITLRMYADRKQWPVDSIHVSINFEHNNESKSSQFERNISINGNLTTEQKERMLAIANQCYVHKILSNPIHINTKLL